ncbi:cell division initiation protein [Streptomyces meridianus]|uniref:Cell division initiation protein n=1 Tax=Streptomyces meridianus TaxID=2938945 RepID=A0ABT0XA21_9ACTN|nr:cell division initiation protein [Streptomyces meridianus]MCM2578763.1 cell division initiation protein [Streptomyces meridianus]
MDVQKKLDEIVEAIGSARAMPMSASCVVNRAELLTMLEDVRAALPGSLAQAQELIGVREQMVEEAQREAERIIESAHSRRGSLLADTELVRRAQEEADRILGAARREAEEVRVEADDYVDSKLANFEVVLTKTIGSVDRGREKLLGRGPGADEFGGVDEDAPERSADPRVLQERADAYVDTKLGAFEAVLSKTLAAVGRGRQKLHGTRPSDELGAHMAAQDGAVQAPRTSDDDYLAGLAEPQAPDFEDVAERPVAAASPAAQPEPQQAPPAPDYVPGDGGQQDYYAAAAQAAPQPGGYQQDVYGYPVQDVAGYSAQDHSGGYGQQVPYTSQQDAYGYPAHDPYAAWQQQGYDPNAGYVPAQAGSGMQQYASADAGQQYYQHQSDASLDETSLFDTSMIDLDRVREYEQGR